VSGWSNAPAKLNGLPAKHRTAPSLRLSFLRNLRWLKTSGIITKDKWGNLPGGEISPRHSIPAESSLLMAWLAIISANAFGDLESNPLTIEVEIIGSAP